MQDQNKTIYFELLKMAKEVVVNEYIDRRAQDHNQWLADAEIAWKLRRVRIPYPTIPPYPTEKEIVARAQTLYDFIENKKENFVVENSNVLVPAPSEKISTPESNTTSQPEPKTEPITESIPFITNDIEPEIVLNEPRTPSSLPSNSDPKPSVSTTSTSTTSTISTNPEDFLEAARIKVFKGHDEDTTTVSRLLPSFLKKLEEMKRLL